MKTAKGDEEAEEVQFDQLPYEIRLHIFRFLRLKERIRLTRVSKKWRETLLDDNDCKRFMETKFIGKLEPNHEEPKEGWAHKLLQTKRKYETLKSSLTPQSFQYKSNLFRWAASHGYVALMEKYSNSLLSNAPAHQRQHTAKESEMVSRTIWRRILVLGSGDSNVDAFKSAILRGHVNAVRWLLSHIPKSILINDRSTLTLAIKTGNAEICTLMLRAGFQLDESNDMSIRPLHAAALLGKTEVVRSMLEFLDWNPSDPHSIITEELQDLLEREDDDKRTALWLAASEGHLKVVELLLGAGANPLAKDFDKRTPIDIALAEGHQEVAEIMKKHVDNPVKRTSSSSSSSSSSSTPTGTRRKKRTKKRSFSLYDEEDDDDYEESDAIVTNLSSGNENKASRHAYATRSNRNTNG